MIQTQPHGEVLEIQLHRPPVNAINSELLVALIEGIRGVSGCKGINQA